MTKIFDDDPFEWDDYDIDNWDSESEPYELDFEECGFIPGVGCQVVAGTSDCEFDCSYRDFHYKECVSAVQMSRLEQRRGNSTVHSATMTGL